jgi:hypothetical protein
MNTTEELEETVVEVSMPQLVDRWHQLQAAGFTVVSVAKLPAELGYRLRAVRKTRQGAGKALTGERTQSHHSPPSSL